MGGTSVSWHVLSLMSQGLFYGTIMESGIALMSGLIVSSTDVVSTVSAPTVGSLDLLPHLLPLSHHYCACEMGIIKSLLPSEPLRNCHLSGNC